MWRITASGSSCAVACRRRRDGGAHAARLRDERGAEGSLLPFVTCETALYGRGARKRLGEAHHVERCLGDAHADVRPRDERRIADQRDAALHGVPGLEIEYRLEERLLGDLHERRDLRREERAGVGTHGRDDFRPDERRRDGDAVTHAFGIGAQGAQPVSASTGRYQMWL